MFNLFKNNEDRIIQLELDNQALNRRLTSLEEAVEVLTSAMDGLLNRIDGPVQKIAAPVEKKKKEPSRKNTPHTRSGHRRRNRNGEFIWVDGYATGKKKAPKA